MGVRGWVQASFSRRIAFQAVLSILLASLLLCLTAFFGSVWMLNRQQDRDLGLRANHMAERLSTRVAVFLRGAGDLAANPVMSTALLDSRERDTYLRPFLGNYRLPVLEPHAIALCDYQGKPLASRKGTLPECFADRPEYKALFESEKPQSTIVWDATGASLVSLQPVLYPGTGRAEGYVAVTLDLRALLERFAAEGAWEIVLTDAEGGVISGAPPPGDDDLASVGVELHLPGLSGVYRMVATERRRSPEELPVVLAAFLAALIGAMALSWYLARRMARRLTLPLTQLSLSARRIAEEGAASPMAVVDGRDEIATLAMTLNTMLAALQRSQSHLEDQVAARTAELHDALAAMGHSEERYRSLFSGSGVAMLLVDPEGGAVVDANLAAESFYGWELSRLKTMSLGQISAAPPETFTAEIANARDRRRSHFLCRHRLADEQIRDVEVHASPIVLDGKTLLLALIHDVTDRMRLERERDRLVTAIEQSPASIVMTRPDGTITYVNAAFCRVTGYAPDEVIGQNPRLLKSGATSDEEYRAIWANLSAGLPWSGNFQNRRKDGSLYWEQARIFPILDAQGTISHYVGIKEDITARKQADEIIQSLNRRYQDVLAAASEVAIIATDSDGIISVFNSGAEKMLGYGADEVVGKTTPALFHLDSEVAARREELLTDGISDGDGFTPYFGRALMDGSEKREWTYCRKDGGHLTVSLVVTPVRSGAGAVTGYLGVAIDITERKQAERNLRDSEERFRSLVEGTTDWVWETDDLHRFSWFSPSFDRVLGCSSAFMLGRRRWDMASDRYEIDPALWQAHIEDLSNRDSFRDFRYWLRLPDGEPRWISISGSPRFDDDGAFLGYRGSGTDITFEAASALRLKMLSTVVEQSPVSVVITDTHGMIEYVNAHFSTVSGYESGEVIGRDMAILGTDDMSPSVYKGMWDTVVGGRKWRGELQSRRKDGQAYWEMVAISPVVNDENHPVHYVSIKEDITFRKEAEARISEANRALQQQAQQLKSVNAELEQFAYVASHDLRQPLRMVSSYLSLIEKRLGADINEDLKSFFGFAVGGARRMDRLILDLLDYSRTGRRKTPFERIALSNCVGDALANLEVALTEAGCVVEVAPDLPVASGDLMEITRLFQNLIGNAVKYRSPERPPRIRVEWTRQDEDWIVSVVDNGMGIPAKDRERAFMIFQRLVAQDAYEGTGIGLAVCRKIVQNHGGRIWIDDGEDGGSAFRFTLPVAGTP